MRNTIQHLEESRMGIHRDGRSGARGYLRGEWVSMRQIEVYAVMGARKAKWVLDGEELAA
jgi:hypothetical protein